MTRTKKTSAAVSKLNKVNIAVKSAKVTAKSPAVTKAMASILSAVKSKPKHYTRSSLYNVLKGVDRKVVVIARHTLWSGDKIGKVGGKYVLSA